MVRGSKRGGSISHMTGTSFAGRDGGSISHMTGTSFALRGDRGGGGVGGDAGVGTVVVSRSIACGQILDGGGCRVARRRSTAVTFAGDSDPSPTSSDRFDEDDEEDKDARPSHRDSCRSYLPQSGEDDSLTGIEEEAIVFPQSTHSWLFTQRASSSPFWFAVGIAVLSYTCLLLVLTDIFTEYEPGNPFAVPYQVSPAVRIAQYLAMLVSLIMEEELPTGLYLLRMISRESLHRKFPTIQFARFVLAAIVRLVMGYLFLFNTFCVVAQATAVLDIFFDVMALQFIQQLDDIAFNLAKLDVFGKTLKHAALSKCFRAEFEKQSFALRRNMNFFLKALYFINMCTLLAGMAWITVEQERGNFHAKSITVTFGEQVWNDAIVTTTEGEETRVLLFSYFNGIYVRNKTHDGRPIYTEQNKFDGSPYNQTIGAEIKYCRSEKAWVFSHQNIRKSEKDSEESDCPWLMKSRETYEYNLLEVTGDWSIWTGIIQQNGRVAIVDNQCHGEVDCNYHGVCNDDGKCDCEKDGHFGLHCEHKKPCRSIKARGNATFSHISWPGEDLWVYQRPVYRYEGGAPKAVLDQVDLNPLEDYVLLVYTGSRWLTSAYPGKKLIKNPRDYWRGYAREYHAFWEEIYSEKTMFVSDATSESSIIGIDMYLLGRQGGEYGPFGELFPMSNPKGSGYLRCIDGEHELGISAADINYLGPTVDFSDDVIVTLKYEITRGVEYEPEALAKNCEDPITDIELTRNAARIPIDEKLDQLQIMYSLDRVQLQGSNIWNGEGYIEFCHLINLVVTSEESSKVVATNSNLVRLTDLNEKF